MDLNVSDFTYDKAGIGKDILVRQKKRISIF